MHPLFYGLFDVLDDNKLQDKLNREESISGYIGFTPSGPIHIGHLIPCMKIRDLTLLGYNMAIMIADRHAMLENKEDISDIYIEVLTSILKVLGADMSRIKFILGSSFQMTPEYFADLLDLSRSIPIKAYTFGSSETKMCHAIYYIMQAIDENYVGQHTFGKQVDFELGGEDQKEIFSFSYNWDTKISYLISPLLKPDDINKMSSTKGNIRITFEDTSDEIRSGLDLMSLESLYLLTKHVFFSLGDGDSYSLIDLKETYVKGYTDKFKNLLANALHELFCKVRQCDY